jgi:hypothetical protein
MLQLLYSQIAQKGDRELWDIERQIQERKENAQKLIGTQDDAICQICQKTKFADGIGHKVVAGEAFSIIVTICLQCFYCQLRSCARCGGKTTSKSKVHFIFYVGRKQVSLLPEHLGLLIMPKAATNTGKNRQMVPTTAEGAGTRTSTNVRKLS